jgi:hypothetical protein
MGYSQSFSDDISIAKFAIEKAGKNTSQARLIYNRTQMLIAMREISVSDLNKSLDTFSVINSIVLSPEKSLVLHFEESITQKTLWEKFNDAFTSKFDLQIQRDQLEK